MCKVIAKKPIHFKIRNICFYWPNKFYFVFFFSIYVKALNQSKHFCISVYRTYLNFAKKRFKNNKAYLRLYQWMYLTHFKEYIKRRRFGATFQQLREAVSSFDCDLIIFSKEKMRVFVAKHVRVPIPGVRLYYTYILFYHFCIIS